MMTQAQKFLYFIITAVHMYTLRLLQVQGNVIYLSLFL